MNDEEPAPSQGPFNEDTFHDYVVAHGYGAPTEKGIEIGKQFYEAGSDYALAAAEIVFRGLVEDGDETNHWQEVV